MPMWTSPRSNIGTWSMPRASVSLTRTFGKRSAKRGRNTARTLSIVCGGAATLRTPEFSAFEQLYAFAERSQLTEHPAAISEQLLASGGQEKSAADTVEKLEAAFVFEIADPPRQSGLADAQTQCRLRDRTEVGHRDEGPQALQVHQLISKMHKE